MKARKILIVTGIYPPAIGGPAQYAKHLAEALAEAGDQVEVRTYGAERRLPSGWSHFFLFLKLLPAVAWAEAVIALDTFSVAVPAYYATRLFRRKFIIRIGGDFLWESYTERTEERVLLKNFYPDTPDNWTAKEKQIFKLTKQVLKASDTLVFTTNWQREIWAEPYGLDLAKTTIIENYYGHKESSFESESKTFVGGTRQLVWKNLDNLARNFFTAKLRDGLLQLDLENAPYEEFVEKIRRAYAVILVSLGDVSPNMILDAIRLGKPFILTRETGLYDRLRGVGIFVDPKSDKEIIEAIMTLADRNEYDRWRAKVNQFTFTHTWQQIAEEFKVLINHY
ncbi:MAG: hypothetical protein COV09_00230 [Candidatus Vogelbacteria bacterium CG10_big_fil_rev_8_21_14_0_10_50_13]|uniref:Glycosyltransferase subfamily 4-like N-terminal domain-containing protein n=1 Tax=Candidatus Vogelbacteria bacterium CG10_big_fil_rev_8_21_14_0_10_50_13 TaxID=1975044 RepID=A0A2H0RGY7_9BACT|nr:MAG: hypothetical protein COV09_00230 [Candidatus Vogelbacteria bacterium CG10_big_fil_rev_8_21_14_0_10_50_13]